MLDQTRLENVECEYFSYLGGLMSSDMRVKLKFRMAIARAAFNKKKVIFTSKLDSNIRKRLFKCYICSIFVVLKLGHVVK